MKNLLASWFRSLTAFESGPIQNEYSVVDPTSASGDGLSTVILAVDPSDDGQSPTMVSLRFNGSGVKLFEKKYHDDQDAQVEMQAMANDLQEAATLSKEGKIDEAKNLMSSLIEKYKRSSDSLNQPSPVTTNTQAALETLSYKGWAIHKRPEGDWMAEHDVMSFRADSLDTLKAKIDNATRKAAGKKLKAGIILQNVFFDTPDEAMEYQEKMKALQGPESGEGKPLWEQMNGEEQVAPSNETSPEEDTELAPPSLSFDRIEKDKAKSDKDIGKRIKEQVKTEVESALEQKSASVFGKDQEDLVEALRKNGRNWDEIKKIFTKELSYNENDTTVFLDSLRQKEEGGPEGLPLPPKPPEDLVSPETHDKLIKEIDEQSEPKLDLKPEPKPLADEIARADNAEIRKVASKPYGCSLCGHNADDHGNDGCLRKGCDCDRAKKGIIEREQAAEKNPQKSKPNIRFESSQSKTALNPLQEPPAVGQTPGQPLAAPVEEAPTFDSPVPPSQDSNPEPEFLEAPKAGDRVYVMGDYETGEDGYEGTMVSDYTSKGDEYAVVAKDNGENAEPALHRVVKASQKKVAKAYYEKKASKKCPNCGKDVWDTSGVDQALNKCWDCGERWMDDPDEEVEVKSDLEVEGKGNEDVIRMFIDNSFPKDKMSSWGTANLKISKYSNGWALINYETPILYRADGSDVIYFNTQKYSVTTSKIQTQIRRNFSGQSVKETDEMGLRQAALEQTPPESNPELQSLHESALKIKAELLKLADDGEGSLLAIYKLDKMVTSYNEASQDWSGETQDFGFIDKGEIYVNSMEEALAKVKEIYGMDFEPFDEAGRFSTNQTENANGYADPNGKYLADYSIYIKLYKEHTAFKKAELEREGEIAIYFHKEGIEKKASDDSAFEGNGWCRVWIQDDEISSDKRYPEILKLQDETARIDALKDLARDLAHEALRLADSAGAKVGVQTWFNSLTPSDHDRIDWIALANPQSENVESAQDPKIDKQAADPLLGPNGEPLPAKPEVPTTLKQWQKAPKDTDKDKALPATIEQAQLVKDVESSLSSLEAIKSLVTQAKAKLAEEVRAIEEKGGRIQIESEVKEKVERLSKLVEATQNQMIAAGDTLVRLVQETKEHPFKPSDKWKVEKLTERLSKYEDAAKYLKQAEDGAQHLATSEDVRELYFFPKKMSKLHKSAGFLETLDAVYEDVMNALKLLVGDKQESAAV